MNIAFWMFWLSITIAHVAILNLLRKTNLYTCFRWLTAYIAQDIIQSIVLLFQPGMPIHHGYTYQEYRSYVAIYCFGKFLDLFFQAAALIEMLTATNPRIKIMSLTIVIYGLLEVLVLVKVFYTGPIPWHFDTQLTQVAYFFCEVIWFFLIRSIYFRLLPNQRFL